MESKQRISISFYEAPVHRPKVLRSVTRPAAGRFRQSTTRSFDRRAMLLAYAQQLRRIHRDRQVARPDWRKWQIAFATHDGMTKGSRWGFRVIGVRPRPRWGPDYERLEAMDGGGGKEKRRWRVGRVCNQWRLMVRWISRRWRLMGSYFKSEKYHHI
ncbi:uncharacterized protein LOC110101553 [Dendrobium catenatum]|uniref:Uncharacterized protein n=1 Tax=Dendrobium catenatum TaxID=906689 RepID=A0A2I0W1C7_9ASPA|nr:uncharacterized protein LOC110101553 [Dendrobium catenatum]PKU69464.1 hypothetical protein MA16_Dca015336 [Dendrobium catenatum]